jgi:hypothetical protein
LCLCGFKPLFKSCVRINAAGWVSRERECWRVDNSDIASPWVSGIQRPLLELMKKSEAACLLIAPE